MAGYFNDSKATGEVIEDGWYHTGDIGEFDEEGILYIIDRKKDLIITGGLNVSPREVEDVLCRHPFVTEAAVVSTPDPMWGEAIRAFLVVNGPVTSEEIINFCGKYLAGYKKPKIVEFIEELPLNTNGKVMKHVLKKLSLSAAAS
jgi:acyl-CoA synthetase (AMP-forming)/AMP-acid ligase II